MDAARRFPCWVFVFAAYASACALPEYKATSGGSSGGASATGGTAGQGGSAGSAGNSAGTAGTGATCAEGTCVSSIVDGEYAILAPGKDATCPAGWTVLGNVADALSPPMPSCECGATVAGSCFPVDYFVYPDSSCSPGNTPGHVMLSATDCVPIESGNGYSVVFNMQAPDHCEPVDPNPSAPSPSLKTLCTHAPGGDACGADHTCLPSSAPPFAEVCLRLPGGASCPDGWGKAAPYYLNPVDTRTYQCTCDPPAKTSCSNGVINVYDEADIDCSLGAIETLLPSVACNPYLGNSQRVKVDLPGAVPDPCAPNLKPMGGKFTWEEAFTLCCPP